MRARDMYRGWAQTMRWALSHPSNQGQRLSSIGRIIGYHLYSRLSGAPVLARLTPESDVWVMARSGAPNASRIVYASAPDLAYFRFWQRAFAQPNGAFLDVGANIGAYTLLVSAAGGKVVAFEPDQRIIGDLVDNIRLNGLGPRVVVDQRAVASEAGGVRMTGASGGRNGVMSDAQGGGPGTFEAVATTLDSVLSGSDLAGADWVAAKVDVEGSERLVIEGGADSLRLNRFEALQLEWNSASVRALGETREPLRDLLQSWGYVITRPSHDGTLRPVRDSSDFGPDVIAVTPSALHRWGSRP